MTIGTYTFYTINNRFAIEIFVIFRCFFKFFVNLCPFLLKINKILQFSAVKKNPDIPKFQFRFLVFGTKNRLSVCSISQITNPKFVKTTAHSVKKTKNTFVKKAIVNFNKTGALFLGVLTRDSQIIYSIYVP